MGAKRVGYRGKTPTAHRYIHQRHHPWQQAIERLSRVARRAFEGWQPNVRTEK